MFRESPRAMGERTDISLSLGFDITMNIYYISIGTRTPVERKCNSSLEKETSNGGVCHAREGPTIGRVGPAISTSKSYDVDHMNVSGLFAEG